MNFGKLVDWEEGLKKFLKKNFASQVENNEMEIENDVLTAKFMI